MSEQSEEELKLLLFSRHYSMESEQGSSYNRNHSTENIQVSGTKQSDVQQFGDERRQLNSSTFKSVNDNSVLIHEGFKKICMVSDLCVCHL
jgi:hypothetical protein